MIFFIPLPPPIHGSSMMADQIYRSSLIKSKLSPYYVNIMSGGRNSKILFRVLKSLRIVLKSWNLFLIKRDTVYISIAISGLGLIKDFLIIFPYVLSDRKIVFHFHNRGLNNNGANFFYHLIYKFLFKSNYALILDETLKSEYSMYFLDENVFVCNNGLNIPISFSAKKVDSKIRLLFLGNLIAEKGILTAVNIWNEIAADIPSEFHVVGREYDVDYNEVRRNVDEKFRDNLFLHGAVYGDTKFSIMQKCDILVFPSTYRMELYPLVILEALGQGIVPVAYNIGAIGNMYSDMEGWHVELNNRNEFREVLKRAMCDTNMTIKKEACISLFKSKYTVEHFENRIVEILEEL